MSPTAPAAAVPAKPHYILLDGLRGVAALMVVAFHIFEAHATSHLDQVINHGYLAVDFFFLLSGFVMGYAYDDRWQKMSIGGFFKRRLMRLQPMVIMGMVVGAAMFYFQGSEILWPGMMQVPVWKVLLTMLIGFTLIPLPPSMEIRGWQEMHPLNGPGWSLFFEYIANILYALFVRRFSKTALSVLVMLSAAALIQYTVTGPGDVVGGWSITPEQLRIGFTRVMFPFFAGLLLFRTTKVGRIKNAFIWCSLLIVSVLAMPRIGGAAQPWANGLYESFSIIIVFPLIVYMGASGQVNGKAANRICTFLGDISYPIYITHYPFIYTYTAWVANNKPTPLQALPWALLTYISSIAVACACLRWYDVPVRAWLRKKLG